MKSGSAAFETWWSKYERNATLAPVALGMAREEIRALFGDPEATSIGSGRRSLIGIWRFGPVEFHFDTEGRLFLVYTEDQNGDGRVIAMV